MPVALVAEGIRLKNLQDQIARSRGTRVLHKGPVLVASPQSDVRH